MFLRKRALDRLAREKILYPRHAGGEITVGVVYPNVYRLAMANLGFQAVFHIFDTDPRVAADRAFLPDADELAAIARGDAQLVSLEQGRPLGDFEILAFSISFETDYFNLPAILRLAGIPRRREERRGRNYPLIIAGGSATFLNPEPIADFVDLFLIGEGEEMVPEFLAAWRSARNSGSPDRMMTELARVEGAYVPEFYAPAYDVAGKLIEVKYRGEGSGRVKRRLIQNLNRFQTNSLILTDESVFGDMYLVEASR